MNLDRVAVFLILPLLIASDASASDLSASDAIASDVIASDVIASELLVPHSRVVEFGSPCTLSPYSFLEMDGYNLAFWRTMAPESPGISYVKWYQSNEIGFSQRLIEGEVQEYLLAPYLSNFVFAWRSGDDMIHFRTYTTNPVEPNHSIVDVASSTSRFSLGVDPSLGFAIAWIDGVAGVKVRRYATTSIAITLEITVAAGPGLFEPRVVVGDQGFLVLWKESQPGGDALKARAYSSLGTPLGSVVDLGLGSAEVLATNSLYLLVRHDPQVTTLLLAVDGQPIGNENALGFQTSTVRVARSPETTYIAWEEPGGLMGAELDDAGLLATPPSLLVPSATNTNLLSSLVARPPGLQLTWTQSRTAPGPQGSCLSATKGETRLFGPGTLVDVPGLSTSGLWISALLLVSAALILLRPR